MRIVLAALTLTGCAINQSTDANISSRSQTADLNWIPKSNYLFEANAQRNGRSVCKETWTFETNSTHHVYSGQQIVRHDFRTETSDSGTLLITKKKSGNGKPDCFGKVRSVTVDDREVKTLIIVSSAGTVMTCFPRGALFGDLENLTSCFGSLTAVKN